MLLLGGRVCILRDSYKGDFKKLAAKYKTAYVPNVLGGLIGNPSLMDDIIHPNDAWYKVIADKIYPVIKNLID